MYLVKVTLSSNGTEVIHNVTKLKTYLCSGNNFAKFIFGNIILSILYISSTIIGDDSGRYTATI